MAHCRGSDSRAPIIKQVFSTSCLGIEIDCRVKWDIHVTGLITSFSQKLNLLKSFYFLPTRLDFYYKVILPSAICGIIVWGSVSKTLFESLERYPCQSGQTYLWPQLGHANYPSASHLQLEVSKAYLLIQNVMPSIYLLLYHFRTYSSSAPGFIISEKHIVLNHLSLT